MTNNSKRSPYTKKQVIDACDEMVLQGKLVKINPDSKNPSYQDVDKFTDGVWGVANRYEPCEKCGDMVDIFQNEFLRMEIGGYWVYLHIWCTKPHIGFYAIKHHWENIKKVKHESPTPHKMTKAEKDLVVRFLKNNFGKQKGDLVVHG